MAKITTAQIKALIPTWLNDSKLKSQLGEYTDEIDTSDPSDFEEAVIGWGAPKSTATLDDLREHIWKKFTDGRKWSRHVKRQLGEDWQDYFHINRSTGQPYFASDCAGNSNESLVQQMFADPARAEKCYLRVFLPKGPLEDNFRLEVVSTPEDNEIVGWLLVVD